MVSGRSRSNQCTRPLSTRSKRLFSPVPSSTTVAAGFRARKARTQVSRMTVRRTVTDPNAPRPYLASISTEPAICTAFGSRSTGRRRCAARARAASGMNSVCWTAPSRACSLSATTAITPQGGPGPRGAPFS